MPILGLLNAESVSAERLKNIRRSVFYFYPNGASPLMGLLSLMNEEVTNDPEFKWFEKTMSAQRTITAVISSTIVAYSTVSADFATWTAAAADHTITADSQYGVKVASVADFRVSHLIKFNVIVATVATEIIGRVTAVDTANSRLAFIAVKGSGANITYNAAAGVGAEVLIIGNANFEGQVGGATGNYNLPVEIANNTQIFRTPFQITGTALKTSVRYDETGAYADMAKEYSINHMIEMEKTFLFGEQRIVTGGTLPIRYTGGVMWYLRRWEVVNSPYRGGAGAAALTSNSEDDKRIITLPDGYLSYKAYNTYVERAFRQTNNKANEKLVLCGSGALGVVNSLFEGRIQFTSGLPATETFGMDITSHKTTFGTLHYRTHPLFTQNPILRYAMLILDVNQLKYRYLNGRDTELLTERQPNNADYREDEWFSECGLELVKPDSCMFIQNVLDTN
jgi:hypothetical protein